MIVWNFVSEQLLSVILQKYQSRSNQSFKNNSVDISSLNLTPNFSFEPRFCRFIVNGYYTKANACSPRTSCFTYALGIFPLYFAIALIS